jgi:hypothetical protein
MTGTEEGRSSLPQDSYRHRIIIILLEKKDLQQPARIWNNNTAFPEQQRLSVEQRLS